MARVHGEQQGKERGQLHGCKQAAGQHKHIMREGHSSDGNRSYPEVVMNSNNNTQMDTEEH